MRYYIILLTLAAQIMVLPLDITMMGILSPMIMDDLNMSGSEFILASNVYNIFFAGFFIASGIIVNKIGYRYSLAISAILFALTSLLCAQSLNSTHLIVLRAMQGLSASMVLISCLTFIRIEFSGQRMMLPMAIFSIYIAVGNAVGPLVTTTLAEAASWHWVFYINIPIALLATVTILLLSNNKPENQDAGQLSFLPWFLFGIGLSLMLLFISYSELASYIVYGICALGFFLVYSSVLKNSSRWKSNSIVQSCHSDFGRFSVAGFIYGIGYWSILFYMPVIARVFFKLSDIKTALFCLIITIPLVCSQLLSIFIIRFKGRQFLYQLSAVGATFSTLASAYLFTLDHYFLLLITISILCFFVGLVNSDVTVSALMSVAKEKSGFYAGLNTAIRHSGFGIGILLHQHVQLNTLMFSTKKYSIEPDQVYELSAAIYSHKDILINGASFLDDKAVTLLSNAMMVSLLFASFAFWLSYRVVRPPLSING